ncbi:hypothetical protein TIFTF001_015285 [Ficus carica]|uniref:Uncharacterized protein n=1 Tax=Ficus carica TaxID=3494 RepID=A0AA88D7Q9_FICCA|nr:hypothetical protein TIFTF001_015285 [Ficus carica]
MARRQQGLWVGEIESFNKNELNVEFFNKEIPQLFKNIREISRQNDNQKALKRDSARPAPTRASSVDQLPDHATGTRPHRRQTCVSHSPGLPPRVRRVPLEPRAPSVSPSHCLPRV